MSKKYFLSEDLVDKKDISGNILNYQRKWIYNEERGLHANGKRIHNLAKKIIRGERI